MREVNQDQLWSQVQEALRFQLAKRTYDMWLKNTSIVSADGGTFRIGVPSKLAKDWLEDRFSGLIQETLQAVTGSEVDIDFVISSTGHRPQLVNGDGELVPDGDNGHENGVQAPAAPPLIPPPELHARFKFSSFATGLSSTTFSSSPARTARKKSSFIPSTRCMRSTSKSSFRRTAHRRRSQLSRTDFDRVSNGDLSQTSSRPTSRRGSPSSTPSSATTAALFQRMS